MSCSPKCFFTATLDSSGRRLMITAPGNKKFPTPDFLHPRCPECAAEELMHAKVMVLCGNNRDLVERYERLIAKGILDPL